MFAVFLLSSVYLKAYTLLKSCVLLTLECIRNNKTLNNVVLIVFKSLNKAESTAVNMSAFISLHCFDRAPEQALGFFFYKHSSVWEIKLEVDRVLLSPKRPLKLNRGMTHKNMRVCGDFFFQR